MLDLTNDTTTRRLMGVVTRVAKQHDVTQEIMATASFVDAGMTSIAMVDLMLAVEAEFDLMIPQKDMTLTNFQSIVSLAKMLDRLR